MPDTMPDVYGYINAISTDRDADAVRAMVMVKAVEGVEAKYREANISIDDKTLIEDSKGEKLTVEQLQEGQEIQAWFEGDVVETLPARGYVKAVRIKAQ
ncbi:DUF3221 domain-containing protein [Pontibacter sp. MBLB2868]|uniref:DUF3221 domain-containing protein n=1 Tax=Pontibacter sp. MBLB2868 TaxID=3451555 RepID=UPI003F75430F